MKSGKINFNMERKSLIELLKKKLAGLHDKTQNVIMRVLDHFEKIIKREVPVLTGELRDSHVIELYGLEGAVYPTAIQSIFVLFNTKPHEIVPVKAQALWWPGARHPVKRVSHPGTKANDYIGRSYDTGIKGVDPILEDLVKWLFE